jgi:hypothetical protein
MHAPQTRHTSEEVFFITRRTFFERHRVAKIQDLEATECGYHLERLEKSTAVTTCPSCIFLRTVEERVASDFLPRDRAPSFEKGSEFRIYASMTSPEA